MARSRKQAILDLLGSEVQLRSKRDLIERFIADYLPNIGSPDLVEASFNEFWNAEREKQLIEICEEEGLVRQDVEEMIKAYHFTNKVPLREVIVSALKIKPKILERKSLVQRISDRIMGLIATFDEL